MSLTSNLLLPPLSGIYAAVTKARLAAYRRGFLPETHLPVTVVSIGNLTTGGTGKTPLVEFVSRILAGRGRKVCILTRGYGRTNPADRVIVSDGSTVLSNFETTGDEPLLLAESLRGVATVISDANRLSAGRWANENLPVDVFVLDDGFQHLGLARDLNLVTIDATNPWGGGRLLPFGRLREPPHSLGRADCVVITRCDQGNDIKSLRDEISKLSDSRPVFNSVMRIRGIASVGSIGDLEPLGALPQPAAAFAAIGNPGAFFDQLKRNGVDLISTRAFRDHHRYTQADVDSLAKEADTLAAKSLITTAKDAIKLRRLGLGSPCYALHIEVAIEEEDEFVKILFAAVNRRI